MASTGLSISYSMDETCMARASLQKMLCTASMDPINLPLSLLKQITMDFADDRVIGRGGFATVYKGILQNGAVALKLSNDVLDDTSFHKEVSSMMKVKHKNIVRFLGYCFDTKGEVLDYKGDHVVAEKRRSLLCFEYLSQGSLRNHICDASGGLEWRARYNIIRGICEGLDYLHQKEIVHADLKPENILLDEYKVPKIADFGLSICFGNNQSQVTTEGPPVGTFGYMAPEVINGKTIRESDIYSLGVIIMEILTGQKGGLEIEHVREIWKTRIETSSLGDTAWLKQVELCAEISKQCVDYDAEKRPNTSQIIERLKKMESAIGFITTDITLATQVDALGLSETLVTNLLDAQPLELQFPLEQNRSIECPVSLINRTDHYVGAWITPTDHASFPLLLEHKPLRGPVFRMLAPRSTLAVGITMEKHRKLLPTDIIVRKKKPTIMKKGTLEVVMAVMRSQEHLQKLKSFIDSMPHVNKYLLKIVDLVMVAIDSTDSLKMLKSYFSWGNWKELLQVVEEKMLTIGSKERVDSLRLYVCKMLNIHSDEVVERMQLLGSQVHRETLTVATYDPATSSQPLARTQMADPKFISTSVFGAASGIDVHPTETWILVAHEGERVSIWNYETQQHVMVLHVTKADVTRVSVKSAKFIAQEQWIVVGDADGWVHVYAYATKAKVVQFQAHDGPVSMLVVQPMDSFLLTSSSAAGTSTKLWYWGQDWKCTREFDENSGGVSHLTFNPRDTSIFASVSTNGDVKVWDACITHPIATLPERLIGACFFCTDDTYRHFLVTTGREDSSWAKILDLKTLEVVHQLGVSNQCRFDTACHPNLPILVTITRDKGIYLWDVRTYRAEKIVELTDLPLQGAMFTGTDFPRLIIPSSKGISIVELDQFAAPKLAGQKSSEQMGIHTS